uniref:Protein DDI1 homolog 2 n=2 Tax=Hirondellea gigas TaxID=1518452 RepID=A0A2P2I187_9CRUS
MLLSVTTDSDSCSLEVSGDLELENFKALCEAEINVSSSSMTVIVNGIPLVDDKKSLDQLGVKDGDLVMIVQADQRSSASPTSAPATSSSIPEAVAQFDFSSIQVPSSSTHATTHASTSRAGGAGASEDDPAVILDLLKTHPEQMGRLRHNNPPLAEAAMRGLEEFTRVLKEQHEAKVEKECQRIRMLTSDPFDAEAQKLIACEIKKQNIDANMEAAMEYNPESFGTVQMLYINCSVNGHPVKAFIDSGAQTTIMSEVCAKRCNIMRLVDQRWAGIAKGIGTQKILGRVHMVQLEIEKVFLASSFSILQEQAMDMLLGLDMLKRHQMVIDLQRNVLQIGTTNTSTRFLCDAELPECTRLTQGSDLRNEEQAKMESEQQAREAEDQAIARAMSESATEAASSRPGDGGAAASASSSAGAALTPNVSEADISEIVAVGFTREEAIVELQTHNGNKTQAIASLFAKRFSFK